jgi:DNA-directed RNA polymerase specialized sigma24 family protein
LGNMSNKSYSELLTKFSGLINAIVSSYASRCREYGIDMDDLKQTARIALWRAAEAKSPDEEGFTSYAATVIRRSVVAFILYHATGISYTTRQRKYKGIKPTPMLYLDEDTDEDDDPISVVLSCCDDTSHVEVEEFLATLPPKHAAYLVDRMNGYTCEMAALRNGIMPNEWEWLWVNNLIRAAYIKWLLNDDDPEMRAAA